MELDLPEAASGFKEHFNGAVPIKRARMELTTTAQDTALIRKQKEANKQYGRGRKIPCEYLLKNATIMDINSF